KFEALARKFAVHERIKMELNQRRSAAVEDVDRGARARIDLEQEGVFAIHQKIGRAQALQLELSGEALHRGCHRTTERRGQRSRTHCAAIPPWASRGRR